MNLNEVQSGVLNIIFRIADDRGLLLLDFKDLRAITQYIGDNAKAFQNQYGNISSASVGAIQRGLLTLEQQGRSTFFGEPMLDIEDWMRLDENGKGVINILSAENCIRCRNSTPPACCGCSELYERLPEAGDREKPKLVFFFDEAHLLFNDAPQVLLDKIEQVIRLIRSKAVGFTSSRRTRRIFPMRFSASWATGFSTPCAPLRRKIKSGENRGPDHARQPGFQHRTGYPGAGYRRSADLLP